MSAAHQYPDLHELVDQLAPAQADVVRAVVVSLITPSDQLQADSADGTQMPRRLSFAGTLTAETDLAARSEEILDEIVHRNAG
jgi:hypothetical protein